MVDCAQSPRHCQHPSKKPLEDFVLGRCNLQSHDNPMRRQCQFTVKRPKKGRFNCCPRTTTLLRSSGGVGCPFSLSWLHRRPTRLLFLSPSITRNPAPQPKRIPRQPLMPAGYSSIPSSATNLCTIFAFAATSHHRNPIGRLSKFLLVVFVLVNHQFVSVAGQEGHHAILFAELQ